MKLSNHRAGKENIPPEKTCRPRRQRQRSSSTDEESFLARRARKLNFFRDHVYSYRGDNGNSSSDCMPRSSASPSTDHLSPNASLFEGKRSVSLFPSRSSCKMSPQNTLPDSGTPGSRDFGRQLVSGRLKTRPARRRRLKTLKNGAPLRYLVPSNSSSTEQEGQISPSEIPCRVKLKSFLSESSECKVSGCENPWEQVLTLETPPKQYLHSGISSISEKNVHAPKKRVTEHKIPEELTRSHFAKKRLFFQTPNKQELQGHHKSDKNEKLSSELFPKHRFFVPETSVKQLSKDSKNILEQHKQHEKMVLPSTFSIHVEDEKPIEHLLQNGVPSNMNSESHSKKKTPSEGHKKKEKLSKKQVLQKQLLQSNTTTSSKTVKQNDIQTNTLMHHENENVLSEQLFNKPDRSPHLIPLEVTKVRQNPEKIFRSETNEKHQHSYKSKKQEILHAAFLKAGSPSEISNKHVLERSEKQASSSKSSKKKLKTHKTSNAELQRFSETIKKQEILLEKHLKHSSAPPKLDKQVTEICKDRAGSLEASKKKMKALKTPNKSLCSSESTTDQVFLPNACKKQMVPSNIPNKKIKLPSVTIRFASSHESVENQCSSYEAARDQVSFKANMTNKADKSHVASNKTVQSNAKSSKTNKKPSPDDIKKQVSLVEDVKKRVSHSETAKELVYSHNDVKKRASRSKTVKEQNPTQNNVSKRPMSSETAKELISTQDDVKKRESRSKTGKEHIPTQNNIKKRLSLFETVNKNVSESNISREQVPSKLVRSSDIVFKKIQKEKLEPYIKLERLALHEKTPKKKSSVDKLESRLSPKKLSTKQVFGKQSALPQNANIPIVNHLTENAKPSGSRTGQTILLKRHEGPNKNYDRFNSCMQVTTPEAPEVASEDDEKIFRELTVNDYSSTTPSQEVSSEGSVELYYTLDGQRPDVLEAMQTEGQSNIRFGTHHGNSMVQIYYGAVKYLPAYAIPSKWEVKQKCREIQHMVNNGIPKQNFSEARIIQKEICEVGDEQRRNGKGELGKIILKPTVCNKEKVDLSETRECRKEAAEKSSSSKLHKINLKRNKRIIEDEKEIQRNGVTRKKSKSIGSRVTQDEMHKELDAINLPSKKVKNTEKGKEGINCTTKKETQKSKKNTKAGTNSVFKSSDQNMKATEDKVNVEKSHCAKKKNVKTSKKNKDPGETVECKLFGDFSQVTDVSNTDRNGNSVTKKKILEVEVNSLCNNLLEVCSVTDEIFCHNEKKVKPSTSKKGPEKVEKNIFENALKDTVCREVVRPGEGKEMSRRNSELEKDTRTVNNVSFTDTVITPFKNKINDNCSITDTSHTTSAVMDNVQRVIEDVANFQPQYPLFSDKMKNVTESIETVVAESKTHRKQSTEYSLIHATIREKGDGSTRIKQSAVMDNVQRVIEDVVANFQPQCPFFSDKMKNVTESIETVVAESKTHRKQSTEYSLIHATIGEKGDGSTRIKQVKDITENVNAEGKFAELVSAKDVENVKEVQSETVEEDPRTILSYLPNLAKELDRRISDCPKLQVTRMKTFGSLIGNEPRESKINSGIFSLSEDVNLTYPGLQHKVGHSNIVPKRKNNIDFVDTLIKKLKIDTEDDSFSSSDSDESSDRAISKSQNHLQISSLSGNSHPGCKTLIWNYEKRNDVSTASVADKTSETPVDDDNSMRKATYNREIQEGDSSTALVPSGASSITASAITTSSLKEVSPWERFFSDDKLDLEDFDSSSFFRYCSTKVKIPKSKNKDKSGRKKLLCKTERTGNWLQRPKENIQV